MGEIDHIFLKKIMFNFYGTKTHSEQLPLSPAPGHTCMYTHTPWPKVNEKTGDCI